MIHFDAKFDVLALEMVNAISKIRLKKKFNIQNLIAVQPSSGLSNTLQSTLSAQLMKMPQICIFFSQGFKGLLKNWPPVLWKHDSLLILVQTKSRQEMAPESCGW